MQAITNAVEGIMAKFVTYKVISEEVLEAEFVGKRAEKAKRAKQLADEKDAKKAAAKEKGYPTGRARAARYRSPAPAPVPAQRESINVDGDLEELNNDDEDLDVN
jgi:hypothetical protein